MDGATPNTTVTDFTRTHTGGRGSYIADVLNGLRASRTDLRDQSCPGTLLTVDECVDVLASGSAIEAVQYFERVLRRGITVDTVFEVYLPRIAADLGTAWDDDRISFVDLALCFSTLQIVMHSFRDRYVGKLQPPGRGRMVIAALEGEPHLFGPIWMSARLERAGFTTLTLGGATPRKLAEAAGGGQVDCIGISCGMATAHAELDAAITAIRQSSATAIAVGGAITGHPEARHLRERVDLWGPDWNELQDFLEKRAAFQLQNVN